GDEGGKIRAFEPAGPIFRIFGGILRIQIGLIDQTAIGRLPPGDMNPGQIRNIVMCGLAYKHKKPICIMAMGWLWSPPNTDLIYKDKYHEYQNHSDRCCCAAGACRWRYALPTIHTTKNDRRKNRS